MTDHKSTDMDTPVVEVSHDETVATTQTQSSASTSIVLSATPSSDSSSLVTILLLFFAYPIGVVVMWVWPKWSKLIKVLVSIPLVLLFLALLLTIRTVMTNPDIQKGVGLVGTMAECSKYTDKVEQQQCIGSKAADFARQQVCQKEGATSSACKEVTEVTQQYASCLKTKTPQECKDIMKQLGTEDSPAYIPGQEEQSNYQGDPDTQPSLVK